MSPTSDFPDDVLTRDAWIRRLAAAVARTDEDLVQDTWVRLLQRPMPAGLRRPKQWLSTVIANSRRNQVRGDLRREARERDWRPNQTAAADPFDLAVYEERRSELVRAVDALPSAQRRVVVARFWEGLEPAAIARRDGESPAAVRQRLRRALVALRAQLGDGQGERSAWLAPLLGSSAPALAGGVLMKHVATVGGLLALMLLPVGWQFGWFERAVTPGRGTPDEMVTAADLDAEPEIPPPDRVHAAAPGERLAARGDRVTLVDASGEPMEGVVCWYGERPFDAVSLMPTHSSRTSGDGAVLLGEVPGDGDFIWFRLDRQLALAVDRADLHDGAAVRAPRRVSVDLRLLGLPSRSPWRFRVWPAWRNGGGSLTHGAFHVERLKSASLPTWVHRSQFEVSGEVGPARSEVRVPFELPLAVYADASGFEVQPEIQEFERPVRRVVAHAARYPHAVTFRIDPGVNADGRVFARHGSWAGWSSFEDGRGQIGWSERHRPTLEGLSWLLRDGEMFDVSLREGLPPGSRIDLRRGEGRAAAVRLRDLSDVSLWPSGRCLLELEGRLVQAASFENFTPQVEWDDVGAWFHEGHLVVQVREPAIEVGDVYLIASDGRVAMGTPDGLRALPTQELAPIDPAALIDRWSARGDFLLVRHEVDLGSMQGLAESRWAHVATYRFRRVTDFGWRLARTASTDRHEKLPAELAVRAPRGARSRLRLRGRWGPDWVDVAMRPR